jgi:uncharacterized protein YvpB
VKEEVRSLFSSFRSNLPVVSFLLLPLLLALFAYPSQTAFAQAVPIPAEVKIPNVPIIAQNRYLSCEYAAVRIATTFWGYKLSEEDFINAIPTNPNPHLGFRGNINGKFGGINDYGVYPEPIARFLISKGLKTKLLWGGVAQLKEEIALGRPVVAWVTADLTVSAPIAKEVDGVPVSMTPYEHALTVYGYDGRGVYVSDPAFGTKDYHSWDKFLRSWAQLDYMALSLHTPNAKTHPNEMPGIATYFYRYWLRNGRTGSIGRPLEAAVQQGDKFVQHFEKFRLEFDTKQPLTQPIVRGLLGREVTENRQTEHHFKALNRREIFTLSPKNFRHYFSPTGHMVGEQFQEFWDGWGALALPFFGYPISRPLTENGNMVQYFERTRLELVTDTEKNTKSVRFGLVGKEKLELVAKSDPRPVSGSNP